MDQNSLTLSVFRTIKKQTSYEQVVSVFQEVSQKMIQSQKIARQTLEITMGLNLLTEELLQTVNAFQPGE